MFCLTKYSQALVMMSRCKGHISTTLLKTLTSTPNCTQIASNTMKGESSNENPIQTHEYFERVRLRSERMPKHVNLILDGTRRWCQRNNIELTYHHFYSKAILLAQLCIKLGIPTFSWFVFATCTWKRAHEDTDLMLRELQESLEDNLEKFIREGIKVLIIGQKWKFPGTLQETVKRVEEATKDGKRLEMIYLVSYGGRWDIVEAARSITTMVLSGDLQPQHVDEGLVQRHLSTFMVTNQPDLMIRCGGKRRFSNIILWQLAHTDMYFSNLLHADFEESHFLDALRSFQSRDET